MKPRGLRYAWLIAIFWLAGTAPAQGQPQAAPLPWERDVSVEDRRLAETLFAQAVELHEQLLRDHAMARYEQALSHWENPHIRWNLALLMKEMGQYLLAWEHLEAALVWGPEAFDEHDRDKLLAMRQMLLRQHLAVIEARCDQPGAEIALDSKPWFRGAGAARQVVLPGEHVITAQQPGYFPVTMRKVLPAGARGAVTVSMSINGVVRKRRWKPWVPWVVLGSGVAMDIMGVRLQKLAARHLAQAGRELARKCRNELSCAPAIPSSYGRALWEHRIGTGAIVVGYTAAAAGLALVLLNQPRAYRTEHRDSGAFELMPMVSPDIAGVSAQFRF